MKHLLLIAFCLLAATALRAQQADSDGDGVSDRLDECPMLAGPASNHGCPVQENPAPTANTPSPATTRTPASPTPSTSEKADAAAKRRAELKAFTARLTKERLEELLVTASTKGLERYKGEPAASTRGADGKDKPTWKSRLMIPDVDGAMCYYRDNGVFVVTEIFGDESTEAATRREAALAATLKAFVQAKGGRTETTAKGIVLYILGDGMVFINRLPTETDGKQYVTIDAEAYE